jgi:uncharacterized protein
MADKNFIDIPYIEVSGEATALQRPNQIFIKIILSEKEYKGKLSMEVLETKMVEAFRLIGISIEEDLVVYDMISNFKQTLFKSSQLNKSKEYSLKVGDAASVSKVFIALEELGIPSTSIERVDHSDIETIRNTVRTKAIENAKARALALTQVLGQTIGPAIHIVEGGNVKNEMDGMFPQRGVYSKSVGGNASASVVEFEKIKIYCSVNVKFILK